MTNSYYGKNLEIPLKLKILCSTAVISDSIQTSAQQQLTHYFL